MSNPEFKELFTDQEAAENLFKEQQQCLTTSKSEQLKLKEESISDAMDYLKSNQAIINKLREDTSNPEWGKEFSDEEKQAALKVVIVAKLLISFYAKQQDGQESGGLGNIDRLITDPGSIMENVNHLKSAILPMFNEFEVNTERDPLSLRDSNGKRTNESIPIGGKILIDYVNKPTAYKKEIKDTKTNETKLLTFVRVRNIIQANGRSKYVGNKGLYVSIMHCKSSINLVDYDDNVNAACSTSSETPRTKSTSTQVEATPTATKREQAPEPPSATTKIPAPVNIPEGDTGNRKPPMPEPTNRPTEEKGPRINTSEVTRSTYENPTQAKEARRQAEKATTERQAPAIGTFELDSLDFNTANKPQVIAMMQANPDAALQEIRESIIEGSTWSEEPEYVLKFLEMIKGSRGLEKIRTTLLMDLIKRGPILALKNHQALKVTPTQFKTLFSKLKSSNFDKETRRSVCSKIDAIPEEVLPPKNRVEAIYNIIKLSDISAQERIELIERPQPMSPYKQAKLLHMAKISEGAGHIGQSYRKPGSKLRSPSAYILDSNFTTLLNEETRKIWYRNYEQASLERGYRTDNIIEMTLQLFRNNKDQKTEFMEMLKYYYETNQQDAIAFIKSLVGKNTEKSAHPVIQKEIRTTYKSILES